MTIFTFIYIVYIFKISKQYVVYNVYIISTYSYSREVYINQPGLVASQGNCLNGLQRLEAEDIEVSPVDGHNVFHVMYVSSKKNKHRNFRQVKERENQSFEF